MNARAEITAGAPPRDACQQQVQRVLQSASFHNASMLQQLLRYLVQKTFHPSVETLKEYTIGIEALNRPLDFDPKVDPIVRVQIHRLRQKLKEYYDSDGLHDSIVIVIPKGQYLPIFECSGSVEALAGGKSSSARDVVLSYAQPLKSIPDPIDPQVRRAGEPVSRGVLIAVALIIGAFIAGLWIGSKWAPLGVGRKSASGAKSDLEKHSDPVKAFWAKYIGNDPTPVIAYPDAVFLLDNYNDLFRFKRGATDYRGAPVDSHLAAQFASNPSLVSRAGKLYYEMLGSSSQNIAVANFTDLGDFSFRDFDTRLEQWRGVIENAHPRPNEASTYHTERDPNTQVLKADYSLITIQPGIVPGRYIADFGGLDTTGSEGAILYATSGSGVDELTKAIQLQENTGDTRPFPVFQALLKVRLEKGYDVVGVSLVAVHTLPLIGAEQKNGDNTQASKP